MISIPRVAYPWGSEYPIAAENWKAIDGSLNVLAERNPDFRVVLRSSPSPVYCDPEDDCDGIRWLVESLPLISSKGLVRIEHTAHIESWFWKRGLL